MTAATQAAVLRLATRGSALARAQAVLAAEAIRGAGGPGTELVIVQHRGRPQPVDARSSSSRARAGSPPRSSAPSSTAAPTSPSTAPRTCPPSSRAGLEVAAVLPRADPRDAAGHAATAAASTSLPDGATVGSSSARRAALLAELRPGLRCVPIRGNVDTRLRKLDAGEVDGLLLAAAGLDRLGLGGADRRAPRPAQLRPRARPGGDRARGGRRRRPRPSP